MMRVHRWQCKLGGAMANIAFPQLSAYRPRVSMGCWSFSRSLDLLKHV